jgi:hypothetical protein
MWSKAQAWGCVTAEITGSYPADNKDVRLLRWLRVMQAAASETRWSLFQKSPTTLRV